MYDGLRWMGGGCDGGAGNGCGGGALGGVLGAVVDVGGVVVSGGDVGTGWAILGLSFTFLGRMGMSSNELRRSLHFT